MNLSRRAVLASLGAFGLSRTTVQADPAEAGQDHLERLQQRVVELLKSEHPDGLRIGGDDKGWGSLQSIIQRAANDIRVEPDMPTRLLTVNPQTGEGWVLIYVADKDEPGIYVECLELGEDRLKGNDSDCYLSKFIDPALAGAIRV